MKIIFLLAAASGLVFIGWRILARPAYKAHEAMQCRLLAVSSAETLARALRSDAALRGRLLQDRAELTSDHKKMKDNFVIELSIKGKDGKIEIISSVNSGWNSRIPQKFSCTSSLPEAGDEDAVYSGGVSAEELSAIRRASADKNAAPINDVIFVYSGREPEKSPVKISAELIPGGKDKYFIVRLKTK